MYNPNKRHPKVSIITIYNGIEFQWFMPIFFSQIEENFITKKE